MAERQSDRYDAFVAYSAYDRNVADVVTRGLRAFGKAWYRRDALRLFVDMTSLAVSPSLWSALDQALQTSRYLIVLLSPAAARSVWVDREITAFLRHHGPDRVLLVLADGELVWDPERHDFDPSRSTAVPPALFGAFSEEPRWVDLAWLQGQESIAFSDPRLSNALASIAAPLHGLPMDTLIGEDERRRLRLRRLARAAVAALTFLLVTSVTLSVLLWQEHTQARAALTRWVELLLVVGATAVWGAAAWVLWGRSSGRRHPEPPDPSDLAPAAGVRRPAPFPLLDYFRGWVRRRREIDVYIGPVAAADLEFAFWLGSRVRRLGQRRLRRGQLRVVIEQRSANNVDNIADSFAIAVRARYFLHLASPDNIASAATNLILQEWLRAHPDEKLLFGVVRLPEGATEAEVLPQILRGTPRDLTGRVFDLRELAAVGEPPAARTGRGATELARLVGHVLGVDPHLVASGSRAALRVAKRRARVEEPLARWNLSETVQFHAHADIAVHLPELQSAMAAAGRTPQSYLLEVLANEDDLISREVLPRAEAFLAQADRNASRETWIRMGRPRRRGPAAALVGPVALAALAVGAAGMVSSVALDAAVFYPAAGLAVAGCSALTTALLINRRAARFEVRRQKWFIVRYEWAVNAAAEALQDILQAEIILPFLRQRLNDELATARRPVPLRVDQTLLTSQTLDRFRLETPAYRRTADRLDVPGGAAIGLAGPWGAGKTTLLTFLTRTRLFHHPQSSGSQVGVLVSAPVRYDSADFIAQILAAVCRETIRAGGSGPHFVQHGYLTKAASAATRAGAALVMAAALTAIPFVVGWAELSTQRLIVAALAGLAAVGAAVALNLPATVRRMYHRLLYPSAVTGGLTVARSARRRIDDLTRAAAAILNRLYFREERSSSSAVKVPAPFGFEANGTRGLVYEGRPWTAPEVVEQFRQFVRALSDSGYRIVVAIDELDKVDDDEEVIRLLNDIKSLFGIPNCYFLVAVSISAMVRFQQRGLPFQDAFESALEEVVHVEPLTATETVELLQRRLTGIPTPPALLCHVLGGGLPRDVIRVLRGLAALPQAELPATLRSLVVAELNARLQAARIRLQLAGRPATEPVRALFGLTDLPFDLDKWLDVVDPLLIAAWQRTRAAPTPDETGSDDQDQDRLILFVGWSLATVEFARTLTAGPPDHVAALTPLAQNLATCRRTMAVDIRDAHVQLGEIRTALGMATESFSRT